MLRQTNVVLFLVTSIWVIQLCRDFLERARRLQFVIRPVIGIFAHRSLGIFDSLPLKLFLSEFFRHLSINALHRPMQSHRALPVHLSFAKVAKQRRAHEALARARSSTHLTQRHQLRRRAHIFQPQPFYVVQQRVLPPRRSLRHSSDVPILVLLHQRVVRRPRLDIAQALVRLSNRRKTLRAPAFIRMTLPRPFRERSLDLRRARRRLHP